MQARIHALTCHFDVAEVVLKGDWVQSLSPTMCVNWRLKVYRASAMSYLIRTRVGESAGPGKLTFKSQIILEAPLVILC